MPEQADRRRTDTRRRVRAIALKMFTEQGYELTSLTQVAKQAGVTRQAVLHHFANKEELLTSSYEELLPALDAVIESARAHPPSAATRIRAVEEFDALVRGEHGASLVCAQVNEHALRGLAAARTLQRRLGDLIRALATGEGPEGMMRGRLALSAVVMAAARGRELGGRQAERHAAALAVARSLIAPETAS
ncbi:TetR/AcrR family transcriptional regulator [Stenotrophomonas sp. NPDC087984]|uniref:TetR/AcrR family transcriptional regulator n=1 Tax=unclassified Streptomyces TaxID=2593676 RepID=UPI0036BA681D